MSQLLSQQRAGYALQKVNDAKGKGDYSGDYASLLRGLPAMILMNGLGQSLAFIRASARGNPSEPGYQLYQDISGWLVDDLKLYPEGDLLQALCAGDRMQYMRAQQEAVELLGWMKRFADAFIPRKKGSE